jgi:hypothetical protein
LQLPVAVRPKGMDEKIVFASAIILTGEHKKNKYTFAG